MILTPTGMRGKEFTLTGTVSDSLPAKAGSHCPFPKNVL